MKLCSQCGKDYDTAGNICLDCIELNFKTNGDIDRKVGDDTVLIHREENVFLNNLTVITPADGKVIDLDHESFCIKELVYDAQGIEYPDWNDRLVEHIKDLKRKMESFRIKEGAARRVLNNKRIKETEKLTPEEREVYIRDIERGNKLKSDVKFEKIEKKKQTLIDRQIESLLKLGMSETSEAIVKLRSMQK